MHLSKYYENPLEDITLFGIKRDIREGSDLFDDFRDGFFTSTKKTNSMKETRNPKFSKLSFHLKTNKFPKKFTDNQN